MYKQLKVLWPTMYVKKVIKKAFADRNIALHNTDASI